MMFGISDVRIEAFRNTETIETLESGLLKRSNFTQQRHLLAAKSMAYTTVLKLIPHQDLKDACGRTELLPSCNADGVISNMAVMALI